MLGGIDIRILNVKEFELSKKLWLECFPEDDEFFVDFYYSQRSKPEYVLGAFLNGEDAPSAMLHIIPVEMRFGGRDCPVGLVSGVCTKPEYRCRGLCARLFEKAVPLMRDKGFAASVLQPFREGFYERFGYRFFIERNLVTAYKPMVSSVVKPKRVEPDAALLASLYGKAMEKYSGYTIRDGSYFKAFIEEFTLPGAELVVSETGCCSGYSEDGGETFAASELFFLPGTDPLSLFPEGYEKYIFPLPKSIAVPEGCKAVSRKFSMILELECGLLSENGSFYGFDRY